MLLAIVAIVIIAVLAEVLLSYFSINSRIIGGIKTEILGAKYCYQGLALLEGKEYDKEFELSFDAYKVKISKRRWGAYDVYYSSVFLNKDTVFAKSAFVGCGKDTASKLALFIKGNDQPVYISDSVAVNGLLFVPDSSVKFFDIGKSFISGGQLRNSNDSLHHFVDQQRIFDWIANIDTLDIAGENV